jgi:hypothetical protein
LLARQRANLANEPVLPTSPILLYSLDQPMNQITNDTRAFSPRRPAQAFRRNT